MSFEDDLKTVPERPTEDVDVLLNGNLYLFRFKQMDSFEWASACDRNPARLGVRIDMQIGYNLRSLTKDVAPLCGVRVDGDTEVQLRVDPVDLKQPKRRRVDEWSDLFDRIDGATFQRITDAIWGLNVVTPAQAVEAAKKAQSGSRKPSA